VVTAGPLLDVVLFDLDDTLYSTTEFSHGARRGAVRAMIAAGLVAEEATCLQELHEVVAEFSSNYEQHFDRLLDRLGPTAVGSTNPAILIAAGVVAYHDAKQRGLRILPDAKALLEALRRAGVRTGVVSAGLQVKQAEKLIRLGVVEYLDPAAIFFSDQLGVSKPNPKIYAKACAALGVEPSRALYVGDRPASDVVPARQAGLRTVWYRGSGGKYCDQPGHEPADHEIADLRALLPILRETYRLPV
jgi:putative hydrolase of the HAD superfamily